MCKWPSRSKLQKYGTVCCHFEMVTINYPISNSDFVPISLSIYPIHSITSNIAIHCAASVISLFFHRISTHLLYTSALSFVPSHRRLVESTNDIMFVPSVISSTPSMMIISLGPSSSTSASQIPSTWEWCRHSRCSSEVARPPWRRSSPGARRRHRPMAWPEVASAG